MPRRKGAKRQGEWEMPVVDFEVGATGPAHSHLHQDLARARLRHGTIDHAYVPWAKEYCRTHRLRNRALLHTARECQRHAVLHRLGICSRWGVARLAVVVHPDHMIQALLDAS